MPHVAARSGNNTTPDLVPGSRQFAAATFAFLRAAVIPAAALVGFERNSLRKSDFALVAVCPGEARSCDRHATRPGASGGFDSGGRQNKQQNSVRRQSELKRGRNCFLH